MIRMRAWGIGIAAAVAVSTTAPGVLAQAVHELIEPGVVRSFADGNAQANAEASVALVDDAVAIGPAPADFGPLPEFLALNNLASVRVRIDRGTNLYGTGFQAGPLERTGRRVEYYNLDNFGWGDFSNRNYQTHPWVLGVRADGSAFGILFDSTWYSSLDTIDPTGQGIIFQTSGPSPRVITIKADSPQAVVAKLAELTGEPFMPPMWSVGYHQSKYSYIPQSNALAIAQEFRNRSIPADVLWLDIDFQNGFRNFTFNNGLFPDPAQLNTDLDAIDFQNIWMANCGIKVDPGYFAYDQMQTLDLAVKRSNQVTDFEGDVWPGNSVWPDFTMQATRDWWSARIADFASIGMDGIWNDMNEPAVFNVPSKTMPDDNWHRADVELGGPDIHLRYHNIYGMQMARATRQGLLAANPSKRPFVLTRASYMGGQRYAATWTGDNVANWYHVDVSIQNILNIGLSGQPNAGPDIGGFNGDGGGDQYARWMGLGALMPFARGHYGFAAIDREPWSYGSDTEDTSRLALNRRYRLLNHLYTQFYFAHTTGLPVTRPLFFAEPSNPALREWDEGFLIGEGLLVVGATKPGAVPQLPPMRTPVYRFDFPVNDSPGAGRDSTDADLPDLYVLGGHIIPANELVQSSRPLSDARDEPIELIVALDESGAAEGHLYEDAGDGFDFQTGGFTLYRFSASTTANQTLIDVEHVGGDDTPQARTWNIRVLTGNGASVDATAFGATPDLSISAITPTPENQPDPAILDGRLIGEHFGPQNLLNVNNNLRYEEISQLRALYAVADADALRIGIEGELAIDGTAIAVFVDAAPGGQNVLDTSPLGSPPAGLQQLTGTTLEDAFAPDRMLFANAFDGSIFCDWVSLNTSAPASKIYLGRQFVGSDDATLSGGNNPFNIRVALGAAGHRTGSGFEIEIPWSALPDDGLGDTNEIKLFATVVKPWGAITNQSLPDTTNSWPNVTPDFTQVSGTQVATIVRATNIDANGDGVASPEDLYAQKASPADVNGDGSTSSADARTLRKRLRAAEIADVLQR